MNDITIDELIAYGKGKIHSDLVKILLGDLLHLNPLELLNHLTDKVSEEKAKLFEQEVEAIYEGKPIQYVLGHVNFYGNDFYINKNVLIPRFETEELVENTINYVKKYFSEPVDIIDLGCGSGVIGITLEKKLSTKTVDLIDISNDALSVAIQNCKKLNSKAALIKSDFFENVTKKYDVIISNPPYIKQDEEIEEIVKNNEPPLALYAGADGLDCYRKIIKDLKSHMKDRCLVAFEIGMSQSEDIKSIIKKYFEHSKIEVKKDLSGKDRMLFIFQNLE